MLRRLGTYQKYLSRLFLYNWNLLPGPQTTLLSGLVLTFRMTPFSLSVLVSRTSRFISLQVIYFFSRSQIEDLDKSWPNCVEESLPSVDLIYAPPLGPAFLWALSSSSLDEIRLSSEISLLISSRIFCLRSLICHSSVSAIAIFPPPAPRFGLSRNRNPLP